MIWYAVRGISNIVFVRVPKDIEYNRKFIEIHQLRLEIKYHSN